MIPYIVVALLPIIFCIPFERNFQGLRHNGNKKNYLILCWILIVLFLAIRSRFVGSSDTDHYYNIMRKAINSRTWKDFYDSELYEAGFQFFVFLLSRVFKYPQWILAITSAIYVGAICYAIYKNSEDAMLSVVMYVALGLMTFQMQGMRQALAMSICLFAFESAKNKRLIPFVLWCILATTMHRTAIVFLVVYPAMRIKFNAVNISLLLVLSVIVIMLSDKIMQLGNLAFDENYHSTAESGGYVATLIYILIILFFLLFSKKFKSDSHSVGLFYIVFMGFICYLLRYTSVRIAERISYYFVFGQLLLLPRILNMFKGKDRTVIKTVVCILIIALMTYRLQNSVLVPYEFFWNAY